MTSFTTVVNEFRLETLGFLSFLIIVYGLILHSSNFCTLRLISLETLICI